jgi:ectoine hydroxylase-related dioxygenase (phytanoyl-CoA dioxygenase family)
MNLSDAEVGFFREHGYLVLKNCLDDRILSLADDIYDRWINQLASDWEDQGLDIDDQYSNLRSSKDFLDIWIALGRPKFRRRPNKYLINPHMFELMNERIFLSLAQKLLESVDISMHGIFNARCQIPHDENTKTPIHQDSQYWSLDYGDGDQSMLISKHQIVTFWFPLQPVTNKSGAMQVISRSEFGNKIFGNYDYDYKNTGFVGLSPKELETYNLVPINMERGDLLIFDQFAPHGACSNDSEGIRRSMDIRYELTASRPAIGKKFGFEITDELANREEVKNSWLDKVQT